MSLEVHPQPTDEEMAAILVAYDALWPVPDHAVVPVAADRWRFAGRRWAPRSGYGGWR